MPWPPAQSSRSTTSMSSLSGWAVSRCRKAGSCGSTSSTWRLAGLSGAEFAAEQRLFGVEQQVDGVRPGAPPPGVAADLAGQFADHDGDDVVGQVGEFRGEGVHAAAEQVQQHQDRVGVVGAVGRGEPDQGPDDLVGAGRWHRVRRPWPAVRRRCVARSGRVLGSPTRRGGRCGRGGRRGRASFRRWRDR